MDTIQYLMQNEISVLVENESRIQSILQERDDHYKSIFGPTSYSSSPTYISDIIRSFEASYLQSLEDSWTSKTLDRQCDDKV